MERLKVILCIIAALIAIRSRHDPLLLAYWATLTAYWVINIQEGKWTQKK